ncbi:hypothetical protein BGZ49_006374 [Haplosporangium sp. Z 27]|nr:hypothetical protein BGZ49_006374 [Haplosporangium sp. Z 27]
MYSNAIVRMLIAVILLVPALVVAKSASGVMRSNGKGQLVSTFTIDHKQYHFNGQVNTHAQPFSTMFATLEYNSLDELKNQHVFVGTIGVKDIHLKSGSGPAINARLTKNITGRLPLQVKGTWSH